MTTRSRPPTRWHQRGFTRTVIGRTRLLHPPRSVFRWQAILAYSHWLQRRHTLASRTRLRWIPLPGTLAPHAASRIRERAFLGGELVLARPASSGWPSERAEERERVRETISSAHQGRRQDEALSPVSSVAAVRHALQPLPTQASPSQSPIRGRALPRASGGQQRESPRDSTRRQPERRGVVPSSLLIEQPHEAETGPPPRSLEADQHAWPEGPLEPGLQGPAGGQHVLAGQEELVPGEGHPRDASSVHADAVASRTPSQLSDARTVNAMQNVPERTEPRISSELLPRTVLGGIRASASNRDGPPSAEDEVMLSPEDAVAPVQGKPVDAGAAFGEPRNPMPSEELTIASPEELGERRPTVAHIDGASSGTEGTLPMSPIEGRSTEPLPRSAAEPEETALPLSARPLVDVERRKRETEGRPDPTGVTEPPATMGPPEPYHIALPGSRGDATIASTGREQPDDVERSAPASSELDTEMGDVPSRPEREGGSQQVPRPAGPIGIGASAEPAGEQRESQTPDGNSRSGSAQAASPGAAMRVASGASVGHGARRSEPESTGTSDMELSDMEPEVIPLQRVPLQDALFGLGTQAGAAIRRRVAQPTASIPVQRVVAEPGVEARAVAQVSLVQRVASSEVSSQASANANGAEASPGGGSWADEAELERLTDEVYRRIRDRLRVERERYGSVRR